MATPPAPGVAQAGDSSTLWQQVLAGVFGTFHSMREKGAHHRVTVRAQATSLAMLLIDAVQVLVLTLGSQYGWSAALLSWFSFSILDALLPNRDPQLFFLVYGATLVVVVLAIADAVYVANMFRHNNFRRLWPLKLLRFIVGIIVTAGFVPTVGIILTPFNCKKMAVYTGDSDCMAGTGIVLVLLSTATLGLYLPFGLSAALVFHDSDANSQSITAKVSGREACYGTVAKLIAVVMNAVSASHPVVASAVTCVVYAGLALHVAMTLPFYHPAMNGFRCSTRLLTAYLALGAFILSSAGGVVDSDLFSALYPASGLFVLAAGWLLPRARYHQLKHKLLTFRGAMMRDLAARRVAPSRWITKAGSSRSVMRGTKAHERRARRTSITRLANVVREATYQARPKALDPVVEAAQHGWGTATLDKRAAVVGGGDRTVFDGMEPYEVELIVRTELSLPGNTDAARRRRRFGKTTGAVPTTQAVEHAMWLFVQAIEEFCDDPRDIATVKIEYARFLQVYTADVNLATAALESARREEPSLEGEFEVFTRLLSLQQKRQSHNIGQRDMNLIALVEYNKSLDRALTSHEDAVTSMERLVTVIARYQKRGLATEHMADRLGAIVERVSVASQAANAAYRRLLRRNPGAPHLASVYGHFCNDVLNDVELAGQYINVSATGTVVSTGGASQSGGSAAGKKSVRSSRGSYADSDSMRTHLPLSKVPMMREVGRQFALGVCVVVGLILAMFVTTRVMLTRTEAEVVFLGRAGAQRTLAVSSAYLARSLSLHNCAPAAVNASRARMAHFKALVDEVHRDGPHNSEATHRWNDVTLPVITYAGNDTLYTSYTNLWELSHRLVADVFTAGQGDLRAGTAYNHTSWHFVMANAITVAMPAFQDLMDIMEDSVVRNVLFYSEAVGALVCVSFITLGLLGCFVFRRALKRVVVIKRGVTEVALLIPPEEIPAMHRKIKAAQRYLAKARARIANATGDEEKASNDRGLGGDDALFTYDVDAATQEARAREGVDQPRPGSAESEVSDSDGSMGVVRSIATSTDGDSSRGAAAGTPARGRRRRRRQSPRTALMLRQVVQPAVDGADSGPAAGAGAGGTSTAPQAPQPTDRGAAAGKHLEHPHAVPSSTRPAHTGQVAPPTPHPRRRSVLSDSRRGGFSSSDSDAGDEEVGSVCSRTGAARRDSGSAARSRRAVRAPALDSRPSTADAYQSLVHLIDGMGSGAEPGPELEADASSLAAAVTPEGLGWSPRPAPGVAGGHRQRRTSGSGASSDASGPEGKGSDGERTSASGVSRDLHPRRVTPGAARRRRGRDDWRGQVGRSGASKQHLRGVTISRSAVATAAANAALQARRPGMPSIEDIAKHSPGALVCTDDVGTVLYANASVRRLFGHKPHHLRGRNVTVFQPPDIAANHAKIMRRVVDGGKPRVIGQAGRLLNGVAADGSEVPILLGLNRLVVDGRQHFVADIQDMRAHLSTAEVDKEVDEEGGGGAPASGRTHVCRVVTALALVVLLQSAGFVFSLSSLVAVADHAAELNRASELRARTHLLAFTAREAVIGDSALWTAAEAAQRLRRGVSTYGRIRSGLQDGDDGYRLVGMSRRDATQHALQFGAFDEASSSVDLGVHAEMAEFERHIHDIVRLYGDGGSSVGPDAGSLAKVAALEAVLAADAGSLGERLGSAVGLLAAESDAQTEGILVADAVINGINACVVCFVYLFVFRTIVKVLVGQARHIEQLLLVVPEHLATKAPLDRYFYRNTAK